MMPIPASVAAVSVTDVYRSTLLTPSPLHAAFQVLKQARQTTLGEYHPDFPSPFGPMTMIRVNRQSDIPAIQRQGLIPQPQDTKVDSLESNPTWDAEMAEGKGLKQFDLSEPGFFMTKPHPRNIQYGGYAVSDPKMGQGLIGVRMSPEEMKQLDMQTRTADESPEDFPEAFVQERIAPERLVTMPQLEPPAGPYDWHDPSTWGNMANFATPSEMAYHYGIDDDFIDRNSPPDSQGRAFNWDELGDF